MARSVADRAQKRARRLETLLEEDSRGRSIDEVARAARAKLWSGSDDASFLLRAQLLLREGRDVSLIREIAASRSAAVQLLLVALFVGQSRRPARNAGNPTPLPLRDPTDTASTSWRYLVALPTRDTRGHRTAARSPAENQVEQLRSALSRLDACGRVELARPSGRGRYERFRLLHEAAPNDHENIYYTLPAANEQVVRVPAAFVLNGWVHALTDNEIIAYLFLLLLTQHAPADPYSVTGLPVPQSWWAAAFEEPRAHIVYRMLFRFGLIRVVRSDRRREDGTIEGFNSDAQERVPAEANRFFVDVDALDVPAVPRVISALEDVVAGVALDSAYLASQGMPGF